MTPRGVEISIAGCVGEMVRGLLPGLFFFFFLFFFFYIMYSLLCTRTRMQH